MSGVLQGYGKSNNQERRYLLIHQKSLVIKKPYKLIDTLVAISNK